MGSRPSWKKKHLMGGLLFLYPSMVNTLREEKQRKGQTEMTNKDWLEMMVNDLRCGDCDEGSEEDDYILTGKGWNLYKLGERKYELHWSEWTNSDSFIIEDDEVIDFLEEVLTS